MSEPEIEPRPDSAFGSNGSGQVPAETGDTTLDEVLRSLPGAGELPVAEQIELFERAHQLLQDRLSDIGG